MTSPKPHLENLALRGAFPEAPRAMRPLTLAPLLLLAGCVLPTIGQGKGDGGSGTDAGTAATGDAAPPVTGAGCTDYAPGARLCVAVSTCPTVVVERDIHPRCGFRVHGSALDLECWCGTSLCPMGVPTTCDQAARLLATQNEFLVCAQEGEGRCAPLR